MRVALAQIDTTVGDVAGNAERCARAIAAGASLGADLVLLPELALTGYPPEDLLFNEQFVSDTRAALDGLAACSTVPVLVGFAEAADGALHNAAALLEGGSIGAIYRKRALPNYGVFDEKRYFRPGRTALVVPLGGERVAPSICEDVWVPGPARDAARAGATVLANISASPFHAGKAAEREAMLSERARESGLWVLYCNLVGGQDELVFDGRSCVVAPDGTVVARAEAFSEDVLVAEIGDSAPGAAAPAPALDVGGPGEVYGAIVLGIRDYVRKNGFTDVVIGLSGGIDSALTAALAVDALGPGHVHGVLLPSRYSSPGSVRDARALAANLGIDVLDLSIEPVFEACLDTLAPVFAGRAQDVTEENLQARIRGTLLMALSNKFGWLVLATGNKSELAVGYSTLYGDMVGGFAPLKDVFKTRVYELARWRNARESSPVIPQAILDKPPSAELRPGQVDQDTLPPYDLLDAILERYVERGRSRDAIVAEGFDGGVVEQVIRMTDAAEYKRRQGPIGVKTTPRAFGRDRRMPITNRYRG